MINNINLNIKSIEAFQYLSDSTIDNIEINAEILNYKLGQPVCNSNIIPNKISSCAINFCLIVSSFNNSSNPKTSPGYIHF